ncbi:hypothetical protein QJS10_CPB18g00572 [Acorus calamus]|uniref:Transposase MuDR plant domain-containing protein n=1 Tax=Acorus calamus TaxID=4465 RepID=A0AAV9CPY7_ACOCL|nr:hypothetical protein QJS10_CPB18g00572 [Acorus calamus]
MDEIFEEVGKFIKWDENDALNMQFRIPGREEYDTLAKEHDMITMFNMHRRSSNIEIFITIEQDVHPTPDDKGFQSDEIFGVESHNDGFVDPMEALSFFLDREGNDEEDFDINVGVKFENIHALRHALRQHVVKNEFCLIFIRSEPSRLTATCEAESCPWRIHASILPNHFSKNKGMYDVHRLSVDRAEVDGPEGRYDVISSERAYTSRKWYKRAYGMAITPFPDKTMWKIEDLNYVVKPPMQTRPPPGRPRKKRIRLADEGSSQSKVGRVHEKVESRRSRTHHFFDRLGVRFGFGRVYRPNKHTGGG